MYLDNASAHQENNETSELDLLGEGEENGELTPGKSLMFAVLEVCLCLLVRQIPALNPNPGGATAILSQKGYVPSEKSGKLIASSLNIMESLPTLCSPQGIFAKVIITISLSEQFHNKIYLFFKGAVAILPTLLYLATGVIRETAVRTDNESTKIGSEAPVHAALHCVKNLISNKYARDHRSQEQWTGLLRSALAKIIDLAKTGMLILPFRRGILNYNAYLFIKYQIRICIFYLFLFYLFFL